MALAKRAVYTGKNIYKIKNGFFFDVSQSVSFVYCLILEQSQHH